MKILSLSFLFILAACGQKTPSSPKAPAVVEDKIVVEQKNIVLTLNDETEAEIINFGNFTAGMLDSPARLTIVNSSGADITLNNLKALIEAWDDSTLNPNSVTAVDGSGSLRCSNRTLLKNKSCIIDINVDFNIGLDNNILTIPLRGSDAMVSPTVQLIADVSEAYLASEALLSTGASLVKNTEVLNFGVLTPGSESIKRLYISNVNEIATVAAPAVPSLPAGVSIVRNTCTVPLPKKITCFMDFKYSHQASNLNEEVSFTSAQMNANQKTLQLVAISVQDSVPTGAPKLSLVYKEYPTVTTAGVIYVRRLFLTNNSQTVSYSFGAGETGSLINHPTLTVLRNTCDGITIKPGSSCYLDLQHQPESDNQYVKIDFDIAAAVLSEDIVIGQLGQVACSVVDAQSNGVLLTNVKLPYEDQIFGDKLGLDASACVLKDTACDTNYEIALDKKSCSPITIACTLPEAAAASWDVTNAATAGGNKVGNDVSACVVATCNNFYNVDSLNKTCAAQVRTCLAADAVANGVNSLEVLTYKGQVIAGNTAQCLVDTCSANFDKAPDEKSCTPKTVACTLADAASVSWITTNAATAGGNKVGNDASACVVATCQSGYTLNVSAKTCNVNPVGSISFAQDYTNNELNNTLNVTHTNAQQIQFYSNAACTTPVGSPLTIASSYPINLSLGDGTKTAYAKLINGAAQSPCYSDTIVLDKTNPVITITNPTGNPSVATNNLTVSGSCSDVTSGIFGDITISIEGVSGSSQSTACNLGAYSLDYVLPTLVAGQEYVIKAESYDLAGNYSSTGATFTRASSRVISVSIAYEDQYSAGIVSSNQQISCGSICNQVFTLDTSISLTATASAGSYFVEWMGACSGTNPVCTITVDSIKNVTAKFAKVSTVYSEGSPTIPIISRAQQIVEQNGKILAMGILDNGSFKLVRYNVDGTKDLTFNQNLTVSNGSVVSYVAPNNQFLMGSVTYSANGSVAHTWNISNSSYYSIGIANSYLFTAERAPTPTTGAYILCARFISTGTSTAIGAASNCQSTLVTTLTDAQGIRFFMSGNKIYSINSNNVLNEYSITSNHVMTRTKTNITLTGIPEVNSLFVLPDGDVLVAGTASPATQQSATNGMGVKAAIWGRLTGTTFTVNTQTLFGWGVQPPVGSVIRYYNGANGLYGDTDDRIYIIGNFIFANETNINGLAALKLDGTLDLDFHGESKTGFNKFPIAQYQSAISTIDPVFGKEKIPSQDTVSKMNSLVVNDSGIFVNVPVSRRVYGPVSSSLNHMSIGIQSYNEVPVNGVAKILHNNTLDRNFNVGSPVSEVLDVAQLATGKLLLNINPHLNIINGKFSRGIVITDYSGKPAPEYTATGVGNSASIGVAINSLTLSNVKATSDGFFIQRMSATSGGLSYNGSSNTTAPFLKLNNNGDLLKQYSTQPAGLPQILNESSFTSVDSSMWLFGHFTTSRTSGPYYFTEGSGVIGGFLRMPGVTTGVRSGTSVDYRYGVDAVQEHNSGNVIVCCSPMYNGTELITGNGNASVFDGSLAFFRLDKNTGALDSTFPQLAVLGLSSSTFGYPSGNMTSMSGWNSDGSTNPSYFRFPGIQDHSSGLRMNVKTGPRLYKSNDNGFYIVGSFKSLGLGNPADVRTTNGIQKMIPNGSGYIWDNSFNPGTGFYTQSGGVSAGSTVVGAAIDAQNRIIVVGYFDRYNGTEVGNIVRINADGSLDTTFSNYVKTMMAPNFLSIQHSLALVHLFGVKILQDGKIVINGIIPYYGNNATSGYLVLNPDGTLDN